MLSKENKCDTERTKSDVILKRRVWVGGWVGVREIEK